MNNLDKIRKECNNEITYPPTQDHLQYFARWGLNHMVNSGEKLVGDITILKYCNMPGVIFDPTNYARCAYTEYTYTAEKYPDLNIHVKVGEID